MHTLREPVVNTHAGAPIFEALIALSSVLAGVFSRASVSSLRSVSSA